tara:strand:+ start:877 stop:1122 length:246 start_codon:yes stop_codon:yes gene_type:complete
MPALWRARVVLLLGMRFTAPIKAASASIDRKDNLPRWRAEMPEEHMASIWREKEYTYTYIYIYISIGESLTLEKDQISKER